MRRMGSLAHSDFGWPAETWKRYLVRRQALDSACEASKVGAAETARAPPAASPAQLAAVRQDLFGRAPRPARWPEAPTFLLGWLSDH